VPFATASKLAHPELRDVKIQQFGPDFAVEGTLHNVYGNY
jgi:hypothetical protein